MKQFIATIIVILLIGGFVNAGTRLIQPDQLSSDVIISSEIDTLSELNGIMGETIASTTATVGGEVSGTLGAIVLGHDALDDQYYDSEGDLTTLLDDNYEGILTNEAGLYSALSDVSQFWENGDSVTGAVGADEAYGAGWNSDTSVPEKDDIYDWGHTFDTDDDGALSDESWLSYDNLSDLPPLEKCFTLATSSFATYEDSIIWSPEAAITVSKERCRVVNGTSVVMNLTDPSNNDLDSITCATTLTEDASLSNNTWSADEAVIVEFGAVTGNVSTVNFCIVYTYD